MGGTGSSHITVMKMNRGDPVQNLGPQTFCGGKLEPVGNRHSLHMAAEIFLLSLILFHSLPYIYIYIQIIELFSLLIQNYPQSIVIMNYVRR